MLTLWLASAFILSIFFVQRLREPTTKLPGPWYTRFTSLVIKYQEFTSNRRLYIHRLHLKYGSAVRIAPNEASFASLDAIREIYASGGSGYDKTELYDLFSQFGIKTMFSTLEKYDHSQRKRELADRYAMTNILRDEHVSAIKDRARAFVSRCVASGNSVDVYVRFFPSSHASPGGLRSLDSDKDFAIMEELTYHQSLQKNLLQYYLPGLAPYFPECLIPRRSPITNEYVLKMAAQQSPTPHSLVGKLGRKDSPLNHEQIAAETKDHMAAGIDTTGDGLCFLMWELSQPHNMVFQEKLHDELRTAASLDDGDGTAEGKTALDRLPYLDAVIKEALRCAPPIPMSFPRYVPSGGKSIEGYFLPEKTIVSCQPYTVHRLDTGVFPEPDRFNPDRWMEETGATERNRLFFAFSTGGRGCTGRNLAMVEMKVLLREVYRRFRTAVAPDMDGSMDIDDQIISSRPKGQTQPAFENTDTLVLSVDSWYVDLRVHRASGAIDWAIAGERLQDKDSNEVLFTHELDSRNSFGVADCGSFSSLPNGDELEVGVMPRSDVSGAPVSEYEEVWRKLLFRRTGESGGVSFVLEAGGDVKLEEGEEKEVVRTFIGAIWGTYIVLRQRQVLARPAGKAKTIIRSGGEVSARREDFVRGVGFRTKYEIGPGADELPAVQDLEASLSRGSLSPGEKVVVLGEEYVVRALEDLRGETERYLQLSTNEPMDD
ncbi:cytochrome P450 [Aspergillus ustus]|uniref:Cytochrome P450 n=1 Tax=Aspergillus ustus TaxID=40382 RepID=A0A0C1E5Y2_ASPUT|nr:cytochrome P450 [Aspergillus ustus]